MPRALHLPFHGGSQFRPLVAATLVARRVYAHEQVVTGERFADQASRDAAAEQVVLHQRGDVGIRVIGADAAVAHHVREHQHFVAARRRIAGGGGNLDVAQTVGMARDGGQQGGGQADGLIDVRRPVGLVGEHHHVAPVQLDGAGELLVTDLLFTDLRLLAYLRSLCVDFHRHPCHRATSLTHRR